MRDLTLVMAACPCCGEPIGMQEPQIAEVVECHACRAELEVLSVAPVALAIAPEVEEDWGE